MLFTCLLMLAFYIAPIQAEAPEFPPDPGELYIPPVIVIMGDTVNVADSSSVVTEVDVRGDSTIVYNLEENVLTLNGATLEVGDSLMTAISYTGTDTLKIVLSDSSTIVADTVISSQSDVVISGEGTLVAEGIVPIKGVRTANITFDSVTMHVRSLPTPASVRRRIKDGKKLDETGGPALSGFGSADFNKTNVSPSDAEYGPLPCEGDDCECNDEYEDCEEEEENVLYVVGEDGEVEVLTEFDLTAEADGESALPDTKVYHALNLNLPMYNILGLQVDATYKGLVIQHGQTYLLK
ncbi:MAG: hypothetical protein IJT12_05620 [Paludibacteraceae bacterium]|nr:hypothetical protein [Paludibacteraceae bacterium]